MSTIECIVVNDSILQYSPSNDKPWNKKRVRHLYNRIGFGADHAKITAALAKSPNTVINELIAGIETASSNSTYQNLVSTLNISANSTAYDSFKAIRDDFQQLMFSHPQLAKLVQFWSGHIVIDVRNAAYSYSSAAYYFLLLKYALGNFKEFIKEIGLTPGMLVYLNGTENSSPQQPNENYARELLELFTMGSTDKDGSPNYDQNDIVSIAKILTGWKEHVTATNDLKFNPAHHNWQTKTGIFSTTQGGPGFNITPNINSSNLPAPDTEVIGAPNSNVYMAAAKQEYEELIDKLFDERADQIAWFICKKLFEFFVSFEIDIIETDSSNTLETAIDKLAETFVANNWELKPVVEQLFKSHQFFEEKNIGVHITSPIEYFASIPSKAGFGEINNIVHFSEESGQRMFAPPNVSGWDEHRTWITQHGLTKRWQRNNQILTNLTTINLEKLQLLVLDLTTERRNPEIIIRAMANHFLTIELSDKQIRNAISVLMGNNPPGYFDGPWNIDGSHSYFNNNTVRKQLRDILIYFSRQPEFNQS